MKKALSLMLTMCMVLSLFATFVISASAEATNVALNKEYTITGCGMGYENLTGQWPASYTANLTDGAAHEELTFGETKNWFAFYYNAGADASFISAPDGVGAAVIDLGSVVNGVNKFRAHLGNHYANGVVQPKSMSVYYSVDGVEYTKAGDFELKVTESKDDANAVLAYWTEVTLNTAVSARYVKFEVTLNGVFAFLNELEVYADPSASAPVEDKVINLLAQEGNVSVTNCETDDLAYELKADGLKVSCLGTQWPSITFKFNAPVDIKVADTYLEIEATITGGNGGSIRLLGPVDDPGAVETDDIYLQHFDADVTPDGGGDAPAGSTVSYKLPVSELAFCIYNADNKYAGKNPITADEISFTGLQVFASGKDCVVNITKLNLIVPGAPATVKEEITVDGDLNDTGWAKDKWIVVDHETGYLQNTYEIQQGTAVAADFGYKYQLRTDDTKLYGAIVVDGAPVAGGNGKGTFPRLWIRDNDEATIYTSFFNIEFDADGNVITGAKYNTSTTENSSAVIENSTFVAFAKEVDGKTVFEFSVDIAEFCADGTFDYFLSVSQLAGENYGCLYHPASEIGPTDPDGGANHIPHKYLPFNTWHTAKDATINVKDIALGEVTVGGEEKEEADTSKMGTAPADPAFTVTVAAKEGWKAGEKLVVTATVDVLKDGVDLSQIMFNLYYDAADVEIVLPEDLGTIITAGKDTWKEDSLFVLSTDGDYGVIECAPATTAEADILKKGDQLVMTFEFTVKDEAEGLVNFQLSNKGLVGYSWDLTAAEVEGAGSSIAVANADALGDTGIYVIAALALVALIGTAVVIKKRA